MALQDDFQAAMVRSKSLPAQPPDVLLELYGLFKQSTAGDTTGKRPGMLDIRGRAKFDAWSSRSGMGADEAMGLYVGRVNELAG
jgi:acyl-CoA-binding protein